jgi:hypothetical protein
MMDRQVSKRNKSDNRDSWLSSFLRGKSEYRQGYDIDDFPLDLDKIHLREWIAGWWSESEKRDVDR